MWARLSVFSGGFDLEAAEEVCAGDGIVRDDVLNLVASLVNKSIVLRTRRPSTRTAWYQMLESIRQYGAERLTDGDQLRALRVRHRDYYRSLAQPVRGRGLRPAPGGLVHPTAGRVRQHPGDAGVLPDRAEVRPPARATSRPPSGTSGSPGSSARATAT